jgi:protein SCO1/2
MNPRRLASPIVRLARALAAGGVACALATGTPALGQVISKERPSEIRDLELANKLGQQVPLDLEFTDSSTGKPVKLRDIFGGKTAEDGAAPALSLADAPPDGLPRGQRPVLLLMMYFRCPILCPKMHQEVTDLLGRLPFRIGRDIDVVMVSFDPLDTPREAERFKTDGLMLYTKPVDEYTRSGWHYLTGTAQNARVLADSIGFAYRYIPESQQYSHGPALFLLTPRGVLSRVYANFEITEPERLEEIRLSLVEASQGRIGTTVDKFMLFCYRFDPRAGSYVLQALRVMQIGGVITVTALGGLVGWLVRGELRKRARAGAPAGGTAVRAGGSGMGGGAGIGAGSGGASPGHSITRNAAVGAP